MSRTNGSLAANRIGAALLLDVMPGDELDIEVWAYNEGGISTGTSRISSTTLVTALVSAFVPGGSGTDLYTQTNSVFTGVSSYLTGGGSSGTTTPFAFLNYIVFDNNFNRVASGHQRVSSVLNAKHLLTLNNVNITQKGYVYIWVSNESNQNHNTYFDDLKVTHTKGPVLQEDHYYPFGANISALSSTAPLSKPNNFKYNGKELNEEFDLNWYSYGAREYDPQIGRFFTQDRFAEKYSSVSPYHYASNDPIRNVDYNGDSTIRIGWNNWVNKFNQNFQSGLQARINDPSMLLQDAGNIAGNIMQTLSDVTGISNLVGNRNMTAEALEEGVKTLLEVPNMTKEEIGGTLAASTLLLVETIVEKKLPLGKTRLGPNDPPERIQGPWTQGDLNRAANGQGPVDLMPTTNKAGRSMPLELHHADNMPGSAIHEVGPVHPRFIWHQSNNQGVTPLMRLQDSRLHWQLRGQEMGNAPPKKQD